MAKETIITNSNGTYSVKKTINADAIVHVEVSKPTQVRAYSKTNGATNYDALGALMCIDTKEFGICQPVYPCDIEVQMDVYPTEVIINEA